MFTRQHYKAIAAIIEENRRCVPANSVGYGIAEDLARYFAADNPRFSREKFLAACKGEK
jgi:hypothetical protein